jgi:hypothetical protein
MSQNGALWRISRSSGATVVMVKTAVETKSQKSMCNLGGGGGGEAEV